MYKYYNRFHWISLVGTVSGTTNTLSGLLGTVSKLAPVLQSVGGVTDGVSDTVGDVTGALKGKKSDSS